MAMIDLDGNECEPDAPECPVLVFATKYVTAWPDGATLGEPTEPWDLLTRLYGTDAHFAAYACERNVRLKTESLRDSSAKMRLFVVDVDRVTEEPIEAWRVRAAKLSRRLPGPCFAYFTRNGSRFVWRIEPRVIASESDGAQWARWYLRQLAWFTQITMGVVADPSCRDWTRLYRVPHGVRDGVAQAHGHCTGGYADGGALAGPIQNPTPGFWPEATISDADFEARLDWLAQRSPAWAKAAEWLRFKPRTAQTIEPTDSRASAQSALAMACRRVREASAGVRNAELFRQALWIAKIVAKGELLQGVAEIALVDAAIAAGLRANEAQAAIKSARKSVVK